MGRGNPAYTPVQVRQSFAYPQPQVPQYVHLPQYTQPPPMAAPEQPPSATKKKIDWPEPVRRYVQRSFDPSNMLHDVSRSDMETKLKQTISSATDTDSLLTIDWDNLALPQEMIRTE